jgi:hypothetical protein
LLLAAAAWSLASYRLWVLSVRAPLERGAFCAALERLTRGAAPAGVERAYRLCRALSDAWAAQCALALLAETARPELLRRTLDEQFRLYEFKAHSGVSALLVLGRMALPLALGSAIVLLGLAFEPPIVAEGAERAVTVAVECVFTGLLTTVFCRASAALVQRQARERMQDVRAVGRALLHEHIHAAQ